LLVDVDDKLVKTENRTVPREDVAEVGQALLDTFHDLVGHVFGITCYYCVINLVLFCTEHTAHTV